MQTAHPNDLTSSPTPTKTVIPQTSASLAEADACEMAFRFMDFPPEIRDQVYSIILCDFQCAWGPLEHFESDEGMASGISDPRPYFATPSMERAILQVNRQVRAEAMEVMLDRNKFVRIFARGFALQFFTDGQPIRIILSTFPAWDSEGTAKSLVKDFKHAVMSYHITEKAMLEDPRFNDTRFNPNFNCDLLIPGNDLPWLIKSFADMENLHANMDIVPASMASKVLHHRLVFHDPHSRFTDPAYDSKTSHQTLLQPFVAHLHGFNHIKVEGDIDPKLAADVVTKTTTQPVIDLGAFLTEVNELKDTADENGRQDLFIGAVILYRQALSKIHSVRVRHPQLFRQGDDFSKKAAEIYFLTHCEHERAKLLAGPEEMDKLITRSLHRAFRGEGWWGLMQEAMNCHSTMEDIIKDSGWAPTETQKHDEWKLVAYAVNRANVW